MTSTTNDVEPTTSATEILRRMLDERGGFRVDFDREGARRTCWKIDDEQDGYCYFDEDAFGATQLTVTRVTPAQAIAATLGHYNAGRYVGLRQGEYWERTENGDYYCGGCGWKVTDHDSYCPECGGALHEYALGTGTCNADETDTWECVRDDLGGYGKTMTVHVMECTECGHTYEHVNGDYEFCPRCGRKRRDVEE